MSACFEALTASSLFGNKVDQNGFAHVTSPVLGPDSLDVLSFTNLAGTHGSTKGLYHVKRVPLREISRSKFQRCWKQEQAPRPESQILEKAVPRFLTHTLATGVFPIRSKLRGSSMGLAEFVLPARGGRR